MRGKGGGTLFKHAHRSVQVLESPSLQPYSVERITPLKGKLKRKNCLKMTELVHDGCRIQTRTCLVLRRVLTTHHVVFQKEKTCFLRYKIQLVLFVDTPDSSFSTMGSQAHAHNVGTR